MRTGGRKRFWRVGIILALLGIYVLVRVLGSAAQGPNVLLIVLDTARGDRFSCMGYERETSPKIDALGKEGVVYTKAFTTDFWTLPAHGSLFSGLYPSQTGATSETNHFPDMNVTMAEVLRDNGYMTAAFVCNSWVSQERGFAQGFQEYVEMWREEGISREDYVAERLEGTATERVIQWLDRPRPKGKPFFLFVNLNGIHMPYRAPEEFINRYFGRGFWVERVQKMTHVRGMWGHLAGTLKLSEEDYGILSRLYDAEVAYADACVGKIIKAMREMDILDETLVIVTSDHGENLGDHGMIDHLLSMYDTTLHIPLVVRYPERFASGEVKDELVSLVDIMPTVLDVCGLAKAATHLQVEATSLCSENRSQRAFIVAENERPINGLQLVVQKNPQFDIRTIDYPMRALRTERHKLIWKVGGSIELYDLQQDPDELEDLAEADPALRDRLHAVLMNWMSKITTAGDISLFESSDEESLKVLRSLGYIK